MSAETKVLIIGVLVTLLLSVAAHFFRWPGREPRGDEGPVRSPGRDGRW